MTWITSMGIKKQHRCTLGHANLIPVGEFTKEE